MTYETPLTLSEFKEKMTALSGMKLIDAYHTQDSVIRFTLKNVLTQITLIVDGNWELFDKDKVICSSSQLNDETDQQYYEKIKINTARIKQESKFIKDIVFNKDLTNSKLTFDNGFQLKVAQNKFGLLSYQIEETEEYVIYSVDEETGKTRFYKSKL